MLTPTVLSRALAAALTTVLLSASFVATGLAFGPAPEAAAAETGGAPSTITVDAKAMRTGSNSVSGLAGVVFGLYESNENSTDSPGVKVTEFPSECTTNASGVCSITVPQTGSGESNRDERFWVKQISAPSGYFLNTELVTGTGTGSNLFAPTPQAFRTPALSSDAVNIPAQASMPNNSLVGPPVNGAASTSSRWVSGNSFAVSRDNNRFDPTCEPGVRIAIVLDLSLSMDGGGLVGAKAAAKKFLGSLVDTGASASLFTFSTSAPAASGNSGRNWSAETVTSTNLDTFEDRIDDYGTHGYTNWDRGLWQVANEQGKYDLAVVLTDGNPTVYGSAGTSTWTNLQKMQEAVYSANAIKGEGTQVFAFGVGDGVSGAPNNLIAVSGPAKWDGVSGATVATSDYFQTTDWDKVGAGLKSLAQSVTCVVPIEVTKTEILADGSSANGAGWEFTATESGQGELSAPSTKTTGAGGTADWELTFSDDAHESTVTIDEKITSKPGNWSVTSISCTNKGVDLAVPQVLPITLQGIGVGDEIKCSVTNTLAAAASVVIDKKWVIDGGTPVNHGSQPAGLGAQLTIDDVNKAWKASISGYTVGDVIEIGETDSDTNEYCKIVDREISTGDGDLPQDVSLAAGVNSFTITNYVECGAKLTLTKSVAGNAESGGTALPGDWTLHATATGETPISGTTGVSGDVAPGVEYTLSETAGPAGYALDSVECRVGGAGAWIEVDKKITVPAQTSAECRFTNEAIAPQLQLKKVVAGEVVDADNWLLTAKTAGTTVHSGAGLAPYAALKAGVQYTLAEAAVAPFNDSEFTASAWDCTVTSGQGFGQPFSVVDGNKVILSLDQKVECVITNTVNPPEAAFTKTAVGATSNADGSWNVTYTLTVTNPSGILPLTYDLTDTPDLPAGVAGDGATVTLGGDSVGDYSDWTDGLISIANDAVIAAGGGSHVYTVTLTVVPSTATDPDELNCDTDGGIDNEATMTPAVGSPITDDACVSIDPPAVQVAKTVDSASQNEDGTWTIVYSVDVSATGTGVAVYDLSDTPQFGVGITVSSASATGPAQAAAWNGAGETSLATAEPIMAGETDNYTVTVVAELAQGVVGTTAADCTLLTSESGTGFLNAATLTAGGESTTVTDCAAPAKPNVQKSAGVATSNGDGTWDVSYSITVVNPSEQYDLYYSLTDTPDLPEGVDPVSATVSGGADVTVDPWAGGAITIVEDELLAKKPADTTSSHTYTVTLTVFVGTDVAADDLECGDGGGMQNTATVTSGNEVIEDDACVTITPPAVSHTKDVTAVDQNQDGTWTVTYDVVVTATGTGSTLYDLTDVPTPGAGITESAAWTATGPSAEAAAWNGDTVTVLADAEPITAGDTHTYTITVHVDVAAGVTGTSAADCELADAEDGTGFLNTATLTAGGTSTEAQDCAVPAAPLLEKNFTSAQQNDDATWNVEFTVTVENPSAVSDLYYSLSDLPEFATGATIESATVALNGGAAAAWNGVAPLATDRLLAAGATDTYELVFTVTVPAGIAEGVLDCTGEPGNGFFNEATLASGNDSQSADDCGPVDEAVLPLLEKTVTSVKQVAGGAWEISYDIVVSTPDTNTLNARYDLADELEFGDGITVTAASITAPAGVTADASWTGTGANTGVVTDQLLPAGVTHTYTVQVTATIDEGVSVTTAADCTLDEGETGTGFLNSAVLTSGSLTREDSACAAPAVPSLTKNLVGEPVKSIDDTITITYLVTATNESGVELNYDLTDTLGFAAGVNITGASVEGPAGVTTRADWDGDAQPIVVEGQSLAANESHEYTVTVTAKLTLFIDPLTLECADGTPGNGYFNGAVLTHGNDEYADDACAPIPVNDLPTLPLPPDLPTLPLTGASVLGAGSLAILLLALGGVFVARRARLAREG